jgi:hypothetical protein
VRILGANPTRGANPRLNLRAQAGRFTAQVRDRLAACDPLRLVLP